MAKGKKSLASVGAVVAGVAVGAAATFLSNKKNRDLVKKKVDEVAREGEKRVEEAKEMIEQVKNTVTGKQKQKSLPARKSPSKRKKSAKKS